MKAVQDFFRNVFVIYGAVVICIYVGFYFITPWTSIPISFPLELFCAVFLVTLLRVFTEKFNFKYAILERVLEWTLITVAVAAIWRLFGWGNYIFYLYIIPFTVVVCVLVWLVLKFKTRKDIASINEKIQQRKARRGS